MIPALSRKRQFVIRILLHPLRNMDTPFVPLVKLFPLIVMLDFDESEIGADAVYCARACITHMQIQNRKIIFVFMRLKGLSKSEV
jgi:hypothetical protein